MPRGYGNYDFVVDSNFQPFSMQEMLTPFVMYKDAFEKAEEAYGELSNKADQFKYLSETLPENSRARQIYEGYANTLNAQAQDLAKHGLNMGNRRALTDLKRRYQGEIGRLMQADTALEEEKKLRRQMNTKDGSMLYAMDNLDIDSFLDGNTPNLYNISGNELYARGAAAGKSASSRIYSAGDAGSTLGGYYRQWIERNGYSKESIDAFRANAAAIPELQQAADDILTERGVNKNLTGANLARARQSVINGIIDGAVYQESVKPVRDEGRMSAAAAEQYALQRDARDFDRSTSGWIKINDEWVYNPEMDEQKKRQEALLSAGINRDYNNPNSNNRSSQQNLQLMSFDTDGNAIPVRNTGNTNYGTEISFEELQRDFPEAAAYYGPVGYKFFRRSGFIGEKDIVTPVRVPNQQNTNQMPVESTAPSSPEVNHNDY